MSTILQALQKSKSDQAGSPAPVIQTESKQLQWKIMFSFALIVIIALLSILIYLLINPYNSNQQQVIVEQPESQQVAVKEQITTNDKQVVKVNFDTQPLAIIEPQQEIPVKQTTAKKITPIVKQVTLQPIQPIQEQQLLVSAEPVKTEEIQQEPEVEVSEELKKRFELALLLNPIEEQSEIIENNDEEIFSDGTDIHQMSSGFQNKVSPISYEAHVYSSIVEDRWIRINGERLIEGDFDSSGQLQLIEIQPQRSIFRVERQSFSLESLVDWKGY